MQEQIEQRLVDAMKSGDKAHVTILRDIRENLKTAEKIKRKPLDKKEQIQILQKMAKQRKQSIEACSDKEKYKDLKKQEQLELVTIEEYLPDTMTIEQITKSIVKIISIMDISSDPKNIGKVMKIFNEQHSGQDGKIVSKIVREVLSE